MSDDDLEPEIHGDEPDLDLRCYWCGQRPHRCRGRLTGICTEGEQ